MRVYTHTIAQRALSGHRCLILHCLIRKFMITQNVGLNIFNYSRQCGVVLCTFLINIHIHNYIIAHRKLIYNTRQMEIHRRCNRCGSKLSP